MTDDFAQKYGPWAVIAGASEGVGASLADQLAERGLDLVLIARNGKLLDEVADGVRERHGVEVRPLVQDLTDPDVAATAWPRRPTGLTSGCSSTTPAPPTGRWTFSTTRSRIRCSRSSWPASGRSRWPDTLRRLCASAGGAASCWSDHWPACRGPSLLAVYSAVKAFNVNFAEGLWAELRAARRRRVLHSSRHDLYGGVAADGCPPTTRTCVMLSEDAAREIIENIGNGPTTLSERTTGRWHRWFGPSIVARWSS